MVFRNQENHTVGFEKGLVVDAMKIVIRNTVWKQDTAVRLYARAAAGR